ncbi:MAG TPA: hypothetical protein VGC21_17125 [Telluria sp.]
MNDQPYFAKRLGIEPDADERTIKRAYARELKLIDQAADPAGFQDLRESYEAALFWLRHQADIMGDAEVEQSDSSAGQVRHPAPLAGIDTNEAASDHAQETQIADSATCATEVFSEFQ